jgi:indolepyruvate decarboxylase
MGSAIPGALGAQMARPDLRPIVIVGDGAFQMSHSELSTIAQSKKNPIVFVLNNNGYTTERHLLDGPFNDIAPWDYHKVTEMIGAGVGSLVETEEELEEVVGIALESDELFVINVRVNQDDVSPALKRMTEGLAARV